MKAMLLLLLIAAAPQERARTPAQAMTAREATAAANAELRRRFPGLDRRRRTIRTDRADGLWHVFYESPDDLHAGGPVIVQVDPRTRRARIVQMPQ